MKPKTLNNFDKKIDKWWNKIKKERSPTNFYEKNKKLHRYLIDLKDIEELKKELEEGK